MATGSLNAQTLGNSYAKKISKELRKWSDQFSAFELVKNQHSREFYDILDAEGEELGTLVLSSAPGRFEKFDMMTLVISGKIKLIRILKYRSAYGGEISNKKWLAQFYESPDSTFVFRKNVDAISGATFSVQGVINELNEIAALSR